MSYGGVVVSSLRPQQDEQVFSVLIKIWDVGKTYIYVHIPMYMRVRVRVCVCVYVYTGMFPILDCTREVVESCGTSINHAMFVMLDVWVVSPRPCRGGESARGMYMIIINLSLNICMYTHVCISINTCTCTHSMILDMLVTISDTTYILMYMYMCTHTSGSRVRTPGRRCGLH